MKKFMMTSVAAAAAMALSPGAMAQDMDTDAEMTSQQQAMYEGWSAQERATYDAWPVEVQTYYWTLDPMQAEAWWQLSDPQRIAIFRMAPAQRAATWQSIARQMNQSNASSQSANARSSANMQYRSNAVVQDVPANPVAGEYPLCNQGRTDRCMNPWEAGKRGPGVTKPLDYWPGRPASNMD